MSKFSEMNADQQNELIYKLRVLINEKNMPVKIQMTHEIVYVCA